MGQDLEIGVATSQEQSSLPSCAKFFFNLQNLSEVKATVMSAGFKITHWLIIKQHIQQQQNLRRPPKMAPKSEQEAICTKLSTEFQALMKVYLSNRRLSILFFTFSILDIASGRGHFEAEGGDEDHSRSAKCRKSFP
jgi:hypothetical protein